MHITYVRLSRPLSKKAISPTPGTYTNTLIQFCNKDLLITTVVKVGDISAAANRVGTPMQPSLVKAMWFEFAV